MARKSKKPLAEQCEKITVRFDKTKARQIAEECELYGIVPAVYVRLTSSATIDNRYLDVFRIVNALKEEVTAIREENIRLRRDFNEAVYVEEE